MNVKQAQIEKNLNCNLTTNLVLAKLAKFHSMDKSVDSSTSESYFNVFQSFFTQVSFLICIESVLKMFSNHLLLKIVWLWAGA